MNKNFYDKDAIRIIIGLNSLIRALNRMSLKKIATNNEDSEIKNYLYENVSLKRRFIEYYVASLLAMFYITITMRTGSPIMFSFWAFFGFLGLRLFVGRSIKELKLKEIRPGMNRLTVAFSGVLTLNFAYKFGEATVMTYAIPGIEQLALEVLRIPVMFLFVYVFALCHEELYRTRLFGYAKRTYRDTKKWPGILMLLVIFETLASYIDAAFWPPSILSGIFVICFVLRLITNKISNYDKALVWALSYSCYWIFIYDYTAEFIKR